MGLIALSLVADGKVNIGSDEVSCSEGRCDCALVLQQLSPSIFISCWENRSRNQARESDISHA